MNVQERELAKRIVDRLLAGDSPLKPTYRGEAEQIICEELAAPPGAGYDLASKLSAYLHGYGFIVPDSVLRTILLYSELREHLAGGVPAPQQEETAEQFLKRREYRRGHNAHIRSYTYSEVLAVMESFRAAQEKP